MELKLHNNSFISSSSRYTSLCQKPVRKKNVAELDCLISSPCNSRRCIVRVAYIGRGSRCLHCQLLGLRRHFMSSGRTRRMGCLVPLASAEDGVTLNGSARASTGSDVEEMRVKLDQSLREGDYSNGLVQALHDAARVFELAIKEQGSLLSISWFSFAWLGVDRNAWVKTLSYQASVYSLLQAASEIASRGDCRDSDINNFVQRSLLRQSAPLESIMMEKLSDKQPEASKWFWSEQVPSVTASFVNYFEGNPLFRAAGSVQNMPSSSGNASDISLLRLALTCIAAITKLGPATISCPQFFMMVPEITGKLMDLLADLVPIHQVYHYIKDIELCREFLLHFGPRAAASRVENGQGSEEVAFWVDLVQKQLQRAVDKEKIWSRLTTSESIEVLERDLAIFGFFIALGRHTKSFLLANGFDVIDGPLEGFIRYLIGGSVLYYPQLSSISSYQLYVEVVCEEMDWLPFYPGTSRSQKKSHGHKSKQAGPPNVEAIPKVLEVCSHWIQSFIKYSKWLETPSNVKSARFLSRGHNKLIECMGELDYLRNGPKESSKTVSVESIGSAPSGEESDSFDKALENVEEALIRLEKLLQELNVSDLCSEKEHLEAACSDLEKIRKLKKEAEFLEASFRAKAASLQQEDSDGDSVSSKAPQQPYSNESRLKEDNVTSNETNSGVAKPHGWWSFLRRHPAENSTSELSAVNKYENDCIEQGVENLESNEIHRFELLRNELIELEKRVQSSVDESENGEDIRLVDDVGNFGDDGDKLVQVRKKESVVEKSLGKMKEASMDVLQGTQLLAIDVAASVELLRRVLIGDELTEKEKKAFQRTLTDLASVVPIGVLMLLPVTAVGHAAMLAAIQRYAPGLIPSTYGPERLDLLRQLEKLKELETNEVNPEDNEEGFT